MVVVLPDWVSPQVATPRIIDKGRWNKGAIGGAYTRTDRPGNRYGVNITLPPMRDDMKSQALLSDLRTALREGLEIVWPAYPSSFVSLGESVVVDGVDISGTSLPLRGLLPNGVIRKGAFLSIEHSGNIYLHENRVEAIADSGGEATLTVEPELRVILDDGDGVSLDRPRFRGVIDAPEWEWNMRLDRFYDGLSFDLVEMQ